MPVLSIQQLHEFERLLGLVPALLDRVEALEVQVAASRVPRRRKTVRVANAERLRIEIREVLNAHAGPRPMTAKEALKALASLGSVCSKSERTVRLRMREIRLGEVVK